MSIPPPRILGPRIHAEADPLAVLHQELAGECAASLSRAYRDLLDRLDAARRSEEECRAMPGPQAEAAYAEALDRAGETLWAFVVQREACGMRNTEAVLRELSVPAAVRLRMGVRRSPV